mmetsp:Transcript_32200/g.78240  ORF Transcript_32200/g.78240 Transcript_32200/m.78240 type:complete len:137 (+) Transcript_32200:665-1075(+)
MALQNYMNDLMEESGAQSIIVVTDDVTNHTFEKRASLRRSQQQSDPPVERRGSKVSQEHGSPSPCQLRRESSESLQTSLVSMNDSPNRGQFCHNKRIKGQLLEEISRLPLGEQRLPQSIPTLKRKPCIYEPRNDKS